MKKKLLLLFLSLSMLFSTFPVGVAAGQQEATIQIVHTNDIHGYYTASQGRAIGFAALKSLIDDQGADLVLDVGDTFHGQAFATVERGMSIAKLMKAVGYDAMTPGNHDWSYGAQRLKELENAGGFKLLASNVVTDSGEEFFESPYFIKNVVADDGTKFTVGVVGVIDDDFYSSTVSGNVAGLKFEEEAENATETAKKLREEEACDIVLAMTHQKDCKSFVANTKGIDAVIAGHEHILIDESYPDSEGKQVPVVEAGCYFNDVGVLELTVDAGSKAVTSAKETVYTAESGIKADETVYIQVTEIEQRQQKLLDEVVGYANEEYPYSWEEIRTSKQAIGKLVTSAYMAATGSDIAIENAGGIRSGLDVGEITYKDLISISPYGNVLITKKLTGKDLIAVLKQSLEISQTCNEVYQLQKEAAQKGEDPYQYAWPDNSGSALQFGGIEIETDGSTITSATIGGEAIGENKIYTVATNNYMAESNDYPALAAAQLQKEYGTCEEALRAYFERASGGEPSDKTAATRGRVAQMLLTAADDYNLGVTKSDIIKGYEDGLLHEDWAVTRAEALVMLKRAFGSLPAPKGQNAKLAIPAEAFGDIPTWASEELEDVFNAGIVAGTAKGIFSPDENVTAEQMKLFISRVFALFGTNEKDDFYSAVAKDYLDHFEMKPGRRIGGVIYDMRDDVVVQTDEIINQLLTGSHEDGTPEQKIADYYETIMDIEGRNQAGYAPIKPFLEAIDNAKDINDLIKVQSEIAKQTYCYQFMYFGLTPDYNDSTKYILFFNTAQPEMDKAFYADTEEEKKQVYLNYIEKRLSLIDAQNAASAQEVYEFDKKLSEKQLSPEEYYDVEKVNNIYSFDQIKQMFPEVNMDEVLACSGLKKEDRILIMDPAIAQEYAKLFTNDNLKVLKTRAKLEIINDMGSLLSTDFIDADNQFNKDYMGIEGAYTDKELAVQAVQGNMNTYLGELYAEKYFSAEQKEAVTKMAKDIIEIYKERIAKLDWMSDTTKQKALKKLDTMVIKVGYPDDWSTPVDNAKIQSRENGGSYFSNQMSINKTQKEDSISRQGKPVDKTEWIANVYEVNAFYNPSSNDITFPAAFLQKPIYDPQKSYEYNLGSVGITIAHEITHAFDNNGAKYDENGNSADWWTPEDYAAFQKLCEKMVALYDGYEFAPGIVMDGTLTLSENVADQGAISCILEIASGLENPNYKELFYSLANKWILTASREYAQYLSQNDVHSMGKARVNPLVANCQEFYEAFGVDKNDGMYIAPTDRVKIW